MKQIMKVRIRGKWWSIEYAEDDPDLADCYGYCLLDDRKIVLSSSLRSRQRQEYAVHELLHACFPEESEQSIKGAAHSIAVALRKMGLWK